MKNTAVRGLLRASLLSATTLGSAGAAPAAPPTNITGNDGVTPLPTGQFITPQALGGVQEFLNPGLAPYPSFVASEAVRARLSPDGTTLAILTAGMNSLDDPATGALDVPASTQFIFIYDVSTPTTKATPALKQVIQQTNSHVGLVWGGSHTLYAAGGNDDSVYVYTNAGSGPFAQAARINLGHTPGGKLAAPTASPSVLSVGIGLGVQSNASGLAISGDGRTLVVANNYNDSISVIDTATNTVRYEQDLRPYANEGMSGVAGGEYPLAVAFKGSSTAYVGSYRDRQLVVVDVGGAAPNTAVTRIPLDGNANNMTFNPTDAAQSLLYVAQDNSDEVAVVNTTTNTVAANIDTRAPAGTLTGPRYTGASPFAVTISPDGGTLFAVNDGSNSIAVIPLQGAGANQVVALLPTAYAPKDVQFSADGTRMYIVNGKSDQGPNTHFSSQTPSLTQTTYPGGNAAASAASAGRNQYQFQIEQGSLISAPVPSAASLPALTAQVAQNNFYGATLSSADQTELAALRAQIKHVIYIVKENRTFDQMLGDLANGANADPSYTIFGRLVTPNFHKLASGFVTLDNFFDAADGSMDGWSLATRGRVTTTEELTQQINYAFVNRGVSYESEGDNRNVPMGVATPAQRDAALAGTNAFTTGTAALPGGPANVLPGTNNVASADAPFGIQQGFIYDAVLNAGGTVRNYGFLVNNIGSIGTKTSPVVFPYPSTVQCASTDPFLLNLTDTYYRGYDQTYPDTWRIYEWQREFAQYVANGDLPSLETVRVSHDHMGNFSTTLAGLGTPEAEQADDDYSVGLLVQTVAQSPYAGSTLIIVTEDDSQDGPDHVDSHRTTTYMAGPYVKQHAVVSTRYNQVNVLRTIEDILGTQHINLNTAYQRPMLEAFDIAQGPAWTYSAVASTVLKGTSVIVAEAESAVRYAEGPDVLPKHDAAYWDDATRGFDFSDADRIPYDLFNRVLWEGMKDGQAYPVPAARHAALTAGVKAD